MDLIFNSGGKPQSGAAIGGAGSKDLIRDTTTATFAADVIEASRKVPVIVDFWAPWCGPCKQLGPALEKVVREARGAVRMVKVNVDQNQELAAQLRVQSVPMVYAFKDGRPVDGFTGAVAESQLRQFVQRLIAGADAGPSLDEIIAEAKSVLAQGDIQTAARIFQQVLQEDPTNAAAMAGLLRCLLAEGDTAQARSLLDQLPKEAASHPDVAAVRAALELAEAAGDGSQAAELRRRVAVDPNDHQARFELAVAYYAANEPEAAVDELLELFRRDRSWNDDGARKQLVKIFEAFGSAHPLTKSGRRRLSSMMFA